jgi:hypothetical protein
VTEVAYSALDTHPTYKNTLLTAAPCIPLLLLLLLCSGDHG